ncbi:hypothetical protein [Streptomyces sp. NPDC001851]|uniref:hypothetical protein n=1 Tax=Streptomyces sp. NPDC001851 TaxID=3154529 RepID=UPI00331C062A
MTPHKPVAAVPSAPVALYDAGFAAGAHSACVRTGRGLGPLVLCLSARPLPAPFVEPRS